MRSFKRLLREERGVSLAFVALSVVALIGMGALAVDLGMFYTGRTEAQRVADLSAMAGAGGLLISPGNASLATALAIDYASRNEIRQQPAVVQPGDVNVDLANERVTVTVFRTQARGNPVATFLARVLGIDVVDISATATAEVSPAGGVNCVLPFAIPDRWAEVGGDPNTFDPEEGDYYIPWDPSNPDAPYTGYAESDAGTSIVIKPFQNGKPNASWYYPWRPPGQQGADDYRENIAGCVDPSLEYYVGQEVDTEPGAMIGPTKQGIQDLISQDPDAVWNSSLGCVTDSGGSTCRGSPRIRPAPMFDPTQTPDPGMQPFTLTNYAGIFIQGMQGNDVIGIFLGYSGIGPAGTGSTSGPLIRTIRLVE